MHARAAPRVQQLRAVAIDRKRYLAVEVDLLKAHRGDVSLDERVDSSAQGLAPRIECALQAARVVGHHEIGAQCEAMGLGREFLAAPAAGGARARVTDLPLQLMGALVVIEVTQFLASIVCIGVRAQQIVGPQ